MSLPCLTPAPGNEAWAEYNRIVIEPNDRGTSATRVMKITGHVHAVARRKADGKWWIVDLTTEDVQPPRRHGPFDTAELAWSTLRLLA